jgi:hypothetical protein
MNITYLNFLPDYGFDNTIYYLNPEGKFYGWDKNNRRFYNLSTPSLNDVEGISFDNLVEGDVLSYDSATQTWINKVIDVSGGVSSFNERTGDIILLDSDVTTALEYTPEDVANKTFEIIPELINDTQYPTTSAVFNFVTNLGYITASYLTGYATESWVTGLGYITSSALAGYATESWVSTQGYITDVISSLGYTPEDSANKSIDIDADHDSDTKYPSVRAVFNWVTGFGYITNVVSSLGYTPENTNNKSTTITGNESSDTLFPTIKSVVDWVTSLFIKRSTNTTNYVQKTSGTGTIGDSQIFDNNNSIGIGTNSPATFLAGLSGLSLLKSAGAAISIAINSTNYFLQYISTASQYIWFSSTVGRVATLFLNNGNFTLGSSTSDLGNKLDISGNIAIRNAQPRINLISSPTMGGVIFFNDGSNRFAMGYQPIQGSEAAGSLNLYSYGASQTILSILANGKILMGANNSSVASARLEVVSTSQGFLPPKMTTAQKNAIVSPVSGLMVFDTTLNKLCVHNGTNWETITSV